MEELSKKVEKLNQDPEILDVIIENEDELIRNTLYENAVRKGISQGIKQGIKQGISQGIEQKARETAKKLLKNKIDINIIADSTGLSKKEITALKNSK